MVVFAYCPPAPDRRANEDEDQGRTAKQDLVPRTSASAVCRSHDATRRGLASPPSGRVLVPDPRCNIFFLPPFYLPFLPFYSCVDLLPDTTTNAGANAPAPLPYECTPAE
jgi:hypothetical protein